MTDEQDCVVISTARLTIRRIENGDWKAVKRIWDDQKKSEYACYDRFNDTEPLAVQARINKWASFGKSRVNMFFAVCLENKVIGYVAFHRRETAYEVGYCFCSDYHGKGYAKESILALLEYIRKEESVTCFYAGTALKNLPSVKLLDSMGFRLTGTEQLSFYKNASGQDIFFEGGIFELDSAKTAAKF